MPQRGYAAAETSTTRPQVYLTYRFMSHRALVLLSASMRDAYGRITPEAVRNWTHQQAGRCPHVYHSLKRVELMERLANSSLLARAQSEAVVCGRNASIVDPGGQQGTPWVEEVRPGAQAEDGERRLRPLRSAVRRGGRMKWREREISRPE